MSPLFLFFGIFIWELIKYTTIELESDDGGFLRGSSMLTIFKSVDIANTADVDPLFKRVDDGLTGLNLIFKIVPGTLCLVRAAQLNNK